MKRQEFKITEGKGTRPVIYEEFSSMDEFLRVLQEREKNGTPIVQNHRNVKPGIGTAGVGLDTYEQAEELAKNGYDEPVEDIKATYEMAIRNKTVNKITPSIVGGAPIVPNVVRGLPRNMMGIKKQIVAQHSPVINLFVDITVQSSTKPGQIKEMALKIVADIAKLESSGCKVNLYSVADFCDWDDGKVNEAVAVKIKDCNQRFNAKRLAFAMIHPAMSRCLTFQWYNYVPGGTDQHCYGRPIANHCADEAECTKTGKEIFGHGYQNVAYVPIMSLIKKQASQSEVHDTIQRAIAG